MGRMLVTGPRIRVRAMTSPWARVTTLRVTTLLLISLAGWEANSSPMTPATLDPNLLEEDISQVEYDYQIAGSDDSELVIADTETDTGSEESLYYPDIEEEVQDIHEQEYGGKKDRGDEASTDTEVVQLENHDLKMDASSLIEKEADNSKMLESMRTRDVKTSQISEIILMAGVGLVCLLVLLGLLAIATSRQTQNNNNNKNIPTSIFKQKIPGEGEIIKQYRRLPVEVKGILPSHLAYHQLYETE